MTVNEYRNKYPSCRYCYHYRKNSATCIARQKSICFFVKITARRCPLYNYKLYRY